MRLTAVSQEEGAAAAATGPRAKEPAVPGLVISGAAKRYGAERALAGVDLVVRPGEVHALLGENGAGKSTLMKIIAGSVRPDSGEVRLDGRPVPLGDPLAARAAGIGIVYQELSLVPALTVEENILLGRWPSTRTGRVDWVSLRDAARRQLTRVGLDERVGAVAVRNLGMAERQLVEIAKALLGDVQVLLLDEPTSALSDPESRRLFELVRGLTASGVAVVYVSHRLTEVAGLASRFTVLKDGGRVATLERAEVTEERLAALMVGHPRTSPATEDRNAGSVVAGSVPARNAALKTRGLGRPPRLRTVDLEVGRGEIVCVFGLVGAGRTRLARCLFGLEPATEGTLELFGRRQVVKAPADAIAAGIGYVGEDRAMGIVPKLSVARNITLASLDGVSVGPVVNRDAERELSRRYIDELAIRVTSPDQPAGTLSGGNQQKVVLGRWLCSGARFLVLDDPTRGVDIAAKEEVFRLVRRLAADGVGVLYLTSEIKEARSLADRLLVMSGGRIVRELDAAEPEEAIMAAAGGLHD